MGRPPDCGCCANNTTSVTTCGYTDYYTTPWTIEKSINSTIGIGTNIFSPNISGEIIQARWDFRPLVSGDARYGCCSEPVDLDVCESGYRLIANYWGDEGVQLGIINEDGLIKCYSSGNDLINYEFITKKTCYFESGIKILGQITAIQPCLDVSILISASGQSDEILVNIPNNWLNFYSYSPYGCTPTLCNSDTFITQSSGYFNITISGSTNNLPLECPNGCCIPDKGFIDFLIIPCANAQNTSGVTITSYTNFTYLVDDYPPGPPYYWASGTFTYGTYCSGNYITDGIYDEYCGGLCYDCYYQCSGCDSWYWSHGMPRIGDASNNYTIDDPAWINFCSGKAPSPPCAIDYSFGSGVGGLNPLPYGSGWSIRSSCDCPSLNSPYEQYTACEDIAACCISGACVMTTCKDCEELGGSWQGKGTNCYGENPIFCSIGE